MSLWTWTVSLIELENLKKSETSRADVLLLLVLKQNLGTYFDTNSAREITRSQLQRLIESGLVTADKNPIQAKTKLKDGMHISIQFPPPQASTLTPEDRPLEILFEDSHLLIVNKPPGLTVHPSHTQMEGTLVHALLHHIQDLSGIGGVLRPGIVHRIDKDTSGALVITKTDQVHVKLAETFSKHDIERCYWALCYGSPKETPGTRQPSTPTRIQSLIGRSPNDRKKMSMTVKEGRTATTYFKRLEEYSLPSKSPFASWLEVTLETGRTHQVRVHLTGIGHSILGDPVYGTPTKTHTKWTVLPNLVKEAVSHLPGQALHARVLGFKHPITGENIRVEAEPPKEFKGTLQTLQNYRG